MRWPPRIVALLLVAAAAVTGGLLLHARGGDRWLEQQTIDARFAVRGTERPDPRVALVGIDDNSLARLPRYPFSRTLHARALDRLQAAGAKLVVYDIAFNRPTTERADLALYDAAERARPVIFATTLIRSDGHTQVLGGDENLAAIGARAAAAQLPLDSDGTIRHTVDAVGGLTSVATAVTHRRGDRAWIDFPGPAGTVPALSFSDVLDGRFDRAAVAGRIVVVGATASVLQDRHDTAAGSAMAGPEIQAAAIATGLRGFPLRSPPPRTRTLLIVALGLLAPLLAVRFGAVLTGAAGVFALAALAVGAQIAFNTGHVLHVVAPAAALTIGTAGALTVAAIATDRERRRLRKLFAAGSEELVEQVLAGDGPRAISPTSIVAGYRIEGRAGAGGMGVVWRATQLALDRPVALKLIATELADDPLFRERFKRESQLAAASTTPT